MKNGEFWELSHLGNDELESELVQLLANGSRTEARILAHIAAVEERRLHLEAGNRSLFDYCCKRLGLSENEAFHRITAARLARRFPLIFALVERRAIHLTAVCLLRDYLTPNNHRELLAEASGKTKLQVLELLARRFPRPDVASRIRKLPAPRDTHAPRALALPEQSTTPSAAALAQGTPLSPLSTLKAGSSVTNAPSTTAPTTRPVAPQRNVVVEPLSAARYRIQLNASLRLKEKLEQARDLLSHSNPSGDLATVVERALDVLLERALKQRFAQTSRPRPARSAQLTSAKTSANTEVNAAPVLDATRPRRTRRGHIANATKREVATRDGLRCTFVGRDGQRCGATLFTQIHHEEPWARDGDDSSSNLRILCASHNRWLAEQDFGRKLIAEKTRIRRVSPGTSLAEPSNT